jgi:3-hydroxyisobutyrate dehydrogenase-like beta-hydroxyacid dehydrogenase
MIVGFIGLGRMGAPMAARIAAAGHHLVAYDIAPSRRLQVPAVVFEDSPASVAKAADIIVTCLPGPAEVADVLSGPKGLLASFRPGAILVETSTISPEQSRGIARHLESRGAFYLDAPISGGVSGAQAGTLAVMVGGRPDVLDRARPVLACFAKDIFHLGPVGTGNSMKLVIQSIFLSQMMGFLEGVSLGERSGIPIVTILEVVGASSTHHPTIGNRYEKLKTGNLDPMFEIGSAVKDLSLAEMVWRDFDEPLPTLASALANYRAAAAGGLARADLIGVRNWLQRQVQVQPSLNADDANSPVNVVGGDKSG